MGGSALAHRGPPARPLFRMEDLQIMSERISRRIAAIAPSATLAVDAQAKALKAEGQPVIGFGAGEPDFPTPAHIVQASPRPPRSAAAGRSIRRRSS